MIMDIADLKAAIAELEDGLPVVAWVGNDALQVTQAMYSSTATKKRGFVLVVDDTENDDLRAKVAELEELLGEAEDEISALEKKLKQGVTT